MPHEYQKYAIEYIKSHPVTALFLDMGLGKTVTTLTAIRDLMYDTFEVQRVLVVAPLRVARDTWPDEIKKWDHLKCLTCSVVVGSVAERRRALQQDADIYIVNRENLAWLYENSRLDFDMVVLDELSSFKNYQSKRFRAMKALRLRVKRIVGLTGTPSGNGLMDLWAEFRILDMGKRLGRYISQYRNLYFQPDKRNGMVVYSYKPLPGAEEIIYHQIADITVSMKATDYLEMPELVSVAKEVRLSEKEKKRYDELKKSLVLELPGGEITAANAASLTLKLSQMANGAIYTDDKDVVTTHDWKLDALEDLVESANGKPVLVAYWFKHDKDRIQQRMEARELKEPQDFADWNAGKIPVALIHPASAGHGLNLQQGGSILVWFGLTWSLELYQQTNARLWRQGQADKTVIIQHIVAKDTIDERILKVLEHKDGTQAALIEAVKADLGMTETENGGYTMKQDLEGEEKRMKAKAYLEQARNINIQIDSKLEQVSALRQLAIKASSTLSPVPPSGTPNPHRLEETIARMMDMEQEVDEAIDGLVELKADITKAISRVPDARERVVLELRYLAFKDWASIADALGLHIRQVYRLHDEALKHIEIPGECH